MVAMYWVIYETQEGQRLIEVNSADARSFAAKDVREAYYKARLKADKKLAKAGLTGKLLRIECVG